MQMSIHGRNDRIRKLALDFAILSLAYCLAFLVRFEGAPPRDYVLLMFYSLPFVLVVKLTCFAALGVRRLSWRHVSLREANHLVISLSAASLILVTWRILSPLFFDVSPSIPHSPIPLGVLLVDYPLSILGVIGLRILVRTRTELSERRSLRESQASEGKLGNAPTPTLLIGAGRAGAQVAKELAAGRGGALIAVGFLDDTKSEIGTLINGVPVLGTIDEMPYFAKKLGAQQALITLETASGDEVRRVLQVCKECGVTAKIIPDLLEVVHGGPSLARMRDVAIEDLLRRDVVVIDLDQVAAGVNGRVVLVTGAGGSIGSELCRLVARFGPATLLLLEQSENGLFYIHRELVETHPPLDLVPCIADILDEARMEALFAKHRPAVVFHAAAHKHVPLMESNPGEAIKNNVLGTRLLADLADRHGVDEFVMISTDKAVNPTSVMGVSKRVAEIYVQGLSQRSSTRFLTVRFGNVLGSSGSVIPIFKEQISRGGPVTVTHPDMKRYFMTIPEACQLVLQAAALGKGGEIFILDMGEPVKIVDLARDLIRLSGLVPEKDIQVQFTGLRPGEKLFEEIALADENTDKTAHARIYVGRHRRHDWEKLNRQLDELLRLATEGSQGLHAKLKEIVPEYETAPNGESTAAKPCSNHHPEIVVLPSINRDQEILKTTDASGSDSIEKVPLGGTTS